MTEALLETFPVSRYDASLSEVLEEIDRYRDLEADWDSEGALAISDEAARAAAWFAQLVAWSARLLGTPWRAPIVGPNADGGINLEWEGDRRQHLVIIRRVDVRAVECVLEEAGVPPVRQEVSIWDAMDRALWAIGSQ